MPKHPHMHDYLSAHWYPFRYLTPAQQLIVLDFTERFCAHTDFFVSRGIEDGEELSWLVGANAALVGGAQRTGNFSCVRWVYLLEDGALQRGNDEALSGDAAGVSTVRINANDLRLESAERHPGQQIAVHEFAHVLDALLGISDSTPALRAGFEIHLENCRLGIDDGVPEDVILTMIEHEFEVDGVARMEFFAYMTELFFTDPQGVIDFHAPLYDDLVGIFGLDMAALLPDLAAVALPTLCKFC